ncbi:hypothetical protein Tco_1006278 [Tanacetum coccineum]|uniref:Uncharacterized protein n=1 Tax=Tanacetum coccineum TaxID=301880 RepID=A0ABQ5FIG5_9ASTR
MIVVSFSHGDKTRYLLDFPLEFVDIETGGCSAQPHARFTKTKMHDESEPRDQHPSETIVFHNEDGNPARANIKQALGYLKDGDRRWNSQVPVMSTNIPNAQQTRRQLVIIYERPHKVFYASQTCVMYFFTSAQDGDPLQDDVRLCLGDDLKKLQSHSKNKPYDVEGGGGGGISSCDPDMISFVGWLYLTRRSLEVLRKFHWTILRGRFNQLSHVSSPLLRKPGEY